MANLICTIEGKNTIEIYSDGHAEMLLANGSRAIIDAEDVDKCKEHKWYFNTRTIRTTDGGNISLGRFIMNVTNSSIYVRFADGNAYNCRKSNLVVRDADEPTPVPVEITPTDSNKPMPSAIIVYKSKGYAEIVALDNRRNEEVRVKIDLDDVDKCKDYPWRHNSNGVYTSKLGGLHRYLMNASDDVYVKFRNGDKTDCRKANLYFESKYKQPVTAPKLDSVPKSSILKKPNLSDSSKNCKYITQSNQGYIILLPYKDEKEFLGPFANKEIAILAYEKRVREICEELARDAYEALIASFMEEYYE